MPYTYATWLSKAMAGDNQCHYAGWFKSHFKLERKEQSPRLDAWTAQHTSMVHDVAAELRTQDYTVYLEDQNTLRVRGQGGAILVAKPDLVALKDDRAFVIDCKTGSPRTRDTLQVQLYMYLLARWSTHPARNMSHMVGQLRYLPSKGTTISLAYDDAIEVLMRRYMQVFLTPAPPQPVPSVRECRFCELGKLFCPDSLYFASPRNFYG